MSVPVLIAGILAVYAVYRWFLYPYCLSPLRKIPGPGGNPIVGQLAVIINDEPGIPMREWVKQYGSVVRVVGPLGLERLVFMKPDALSRILVSGWAEYPRVIGFKFLINSIHKSLAHIPSKNSWPCRGLWASDCIGERAQENA